ncbi:MAG: hypothetical protein M1817_004504 [Caeruleum heppii]|nr:MAG: hypothetical protein M1817_004504 [Caeruleum heppii]
MTSAVSELDAALQAMLLLKPPGVSGSKINSITALCTANVQSESVLVQKLYTHFKKAPGTHKLGVLYVVDSVTRQWVDHSRKNGQLIGTAAGDGSFAAGVNRVTELLPILMTDIIQHAPEDQKDKIKKLVDIWERGSTFPAPLISSFKEKLNASKNAQSTTPPGTPPQIPAQAHGQQQPAAPAAPAPNTSDILAALANIAKQNTANPAPATASMPPKSDPAPLAYNQPTFSAPPLPTNATPNPPLPANGQPVNLPPVGANMASQFLGNMLPGNAAQIAPSTQSNAPGAPAPMMPQMNAGGQDALQQQLMVIQVLMQQGVPQDQWAPILAALSGNNAAAAPRLRGVVEEMHHHVIRLALLTPKCGRLHDDINVALAPARRNPTTETVGRLHLVVVIALPMASMATLPPAVDIVGRTTTVVAEAQRAEVEVTTIVREARRRLDEAEARHLRPLEDLILSRTLFVGGVTCSEQELRNVFSRFGQVQTCIVNQEKRHGFVKMISRVDALAAKEGMENFKPQDMQLRTKWGVGFGPRDCSDYQTGISVIPIGRLTEADRKWMLTAEYGGSGGKPIEGGMVVEEPDIEIGAGVSSKAISRRMATDQGGKTGPRSSRGGNEGAGRFRRNDRPDYPEREPAGTVGVPPAVPGFGFQFPTFPNGMPMIPPGYGFPNNAPQAQSQGQN